MVQAPMIGGAELATTKALAVADDPDVLRLVSSQLRSLGYEVVEAVSTVEALHILSMDGSFDLLFTDAMLSQEIPGLDLAWRARQAFGSRIKVLLASGHLEEDAFRQHGTSEDEILLLPKPYTREGLMRALEGVLSTSA